MSLELSPHETFTFQCRSCGNCCRDNREIILNPQDIFNLSRRHGLNTRRFIKQYCDYEPAAGYGSFPIVTLKTPGGDCIFLHANLCLAHSDRPACCRNFPVGDIFGPQGEIRRVLMEPAPGCLGFNDAPEHNLETWRIASGLCELEPGAEITRIAFSLSARHPADGTLRDKLYGILCDFDPLPAPGEASESTGPLTPDTAMRVLRKRLETLSACR